MNSKKNQIFGINSLIFIGMTALSASICMSTDSTSAYASSSANLKHALTSKGYHQSLFVTKPLHEKIKTPLAPPRKPEPKHPGFIFADKGDWKSVAKVISQQGHSELGKILTWQYIKSPDSRPDFETIRKFLVQNPDWPSRSILIRNAEKALFRAPNLGAKEQWFANGHANTLDGELWLIEKAKHDGRIQEAADRIRRVWSRYSLNKSDEKEFLNTYGNNLHDAHHWQRMDTLIWERRFREARRQLKRLHGKTRLLAEARIAFSTRSRKALKSYALVANSLRSSPGLVYERVRWLRRKGKEQEATEALLAYNGSRPFPHLWWTETSILARDAIKDKRFGDAYKLATQMQQSSTQRKAEAEWLAGWIALEFLNKPKIAAKHFETLYNAVKTPVSLARGAYWIARANDISGNIKNAKIWYEKATNFNTAFYGQLAAYKVGQHSLLSEPQKPIPEQANQWLNTHEFSKTLQILHHNQETQTFKTFARAFYNAAKTDNERRAVVSYVASMSLGQSVHLARVLRQQNINDLILTYPIPEWIDLPEIPEKTLVLSLIRQESNFDTFAKSPVGARGLMQIMPSTAKVEARLMKRPLSLYALTHDPNTNVEIGSHYLQRLLESYDNHQALALAAYNAGPSNVNKWIKIYGDPRTKEIDTITWMESIPFKETRNYVQRIMENHYIYQWLSRDSSENRTTIQTQKKG